MVGDAPLSTPDVAGGGILQCPGLPANYLSVTAARPSPLRAAIVPVMPTAAEWAREMAARRAK
jgi:hypothetical protein